MRSPWTLIQSNSHEAPRCPCIVRLAARFRSTFRCKTSRYLQSEQLLSCGMGIQSRPGSTSQCLQGLRKSFDDNQDYLSYVSHDLESRLVDANHARVTSTFAQVTLTTTTTPCPTGSVTPVLPEPSSDMPSSTESASTTIAEQRIQGRQLQPSLSSSTRTTFGSVPTNIANICDVENYRSACLCQSSFVSSALVTSMSTVSIQCIS